MIPPKASSSTTRRPYGGRSNTSTLSRQPISNCRRHSSKSKRMRSLRSGCLSTIVPTAAGTSGRRQQTFRLLCSDPRCVIGTSIPRCAAGRKEQRRSFDWADSRRARDVVSSVCGPLVRMMRTIPRPPGLVLKCWALCSGKHGRHACVTTGRNLLFRPRPFSVTRGRSYRAAGDSTCRYRVASAGTRRRPLPLASVSRYDLLHGAELHLRQISILDVKHVQ